MSRQRLTGRPGAVVAVILGALLGSSAFAAPGGSSAQSGFEGFWKGVDRADGSELQMSIVRTQGDYEILFRDTYFSLCIADGFTSGRGLNAGTGTPIGNKKLAFSFTLFCFADNDPTTPVPVNDSSVDLTLRSKGNVLVVGFEPEIFLHREGGRP